MNCEVQEAEVRDESGNATGTRGYVNIPTHELSNLTTAQIAEFSLNVVDGKNYDHFTVDFGTGKGIVYPGCSMDPAYIGNIDDNGNIVNTEKYLYVSSDRKVRMEKVDSETADQPERQDVISEEDQEGWKKLESLGNIQTENGILTVTITMPADLAKGTTQEELDAAKGKSYLSAVVNEDGSVTFKMTRLQHRNMLNQLSDSFESSIQEMIDDNETYTISKVTHNRDFTVFDVTLDGTEAGLNDSFSVLSFYMYGGIYGVFSGQRPEHVVVNFRDPNGNLINTADSANMNNQQ